MRLREISGFSFRQGTGGSAPAPVPWRNENPEIPAKVIGESSFS